MNELFSIAGKVAVITGAGGVLGGNIAQHFVQQGAKVVAIDIRQEQLDNRVTESVLSATYWILPIWKK